MVWSIQQSHSAVVCRLIPRSSIALSSYLFLLVISISIALLIAIRLIWFSFLVVAKCCCCCCYSPEIPDIPISIQILALISMGINLVFKLHRRINFAVLLVVIKMIGIFSVVYEQASAPQRRARVSFTKKIEIFGF